MSKYQPRILINNPEKNVPDNIIEQFFLAIKTADIDKIRNFSNMYKNKYNLIEKGSKGSSADSGKTPFHVVLELDDKVANNDTKLKIMHYLDQMGAPMDLPDAANVWPIHLAATLQSEKILDFFIKRKVAINHKDSSNNTPLHWGISGKEITCPKPISVKDLVPPQKTDKLPLNKSLENINKKLIKILNENSTINSDLIHMINTIIKIPEMYVDDKMERNLQTDLLNIFIGTATTETFPSNVPTDITTVIIPKTGGMTAQQAKIEQLIDRTYSTINDELLKGLAKAMDIVPNNGGWGPSIPTGPNPGDRAPPNNLQKITKMTQAEMLVEVENEYRGLQNRLSSINTTISDRIVRTNIPTIVATIDRNFIDLLIFCPEGVDEQKRPICVTSDNGERVTLTKMLFLLIYGYYKSSYGIFFAQKIMDNFRLMNQTSYNEITNNPFTPGWNGWTTNQDGMLFQSYIPPMIASSRFDPVRNVIDIAIARTAVGYYRPVPPQVDPECINSELRRYFTDSDERPGAALPPGKVPHNEYNSILGRTSLNDLFDNPDYARFRDMVINLRPPYRNMNVTWFNMLDTLIREINPRPTFPVPPLPLPLFASNPPYDIKQTFYANDVFGRWSLIVAGIETPRFIPNTNLPRTPFPNATPFKMQPRGRFDRYTFHELFRMMNAIVFFLVQKQFLINWRPGIYDTIINNWDGYIDGVASAEVLNVNRATGATTPSGVTVGQAYPEFIFLYRILVVRVQRRIADIINTCIRNIIDTAVADVGSNDPDVVTLRNFGQPVDDAHMLNLLLPSDPGHLSFNVPAPGDPFTDLKNRKWDIRNQLVNWLNSFRRNIPADLQNAIIDAIYPRVPTMPFIGPLRYINYFNYGNLHLLRQEIEENVVPLQAPILTVIDNNEFRTQIREYFKTRNFMSRYNIVTRNIQMDDVFDRNRIKLDSVPTLMTDLFFVTEFYGFRFVRIKQLLLQLQQEISMVTTVIADINLFMNAQSYYHIPQIFLPALVKQIIIIIFFLINIRNDLILLDQRKNIFYPHIDITNADVIHVITLGASFNEYIDGQLQNIYDNLFEIVTHHNDVIDFLNFTSAINLITQNRIEPRPQPSTSTRIFTMNLIPLDSLPNLFTDVSNLQTLESIMRLYRIPQITYHHDNTGILRIRTVSFGPTGNPAIGGRYDFPTYRNIIEYERIPPPNIIPPPISNSPGPGNNSQLNIIGTNTVNGPDFGTQEPPNSIAGEWLNLRIPANIPYDPKTQIRYSVAFIRFLYNHYQFEWLQGMPPSIKRSVGSHLKMIKQRIIENVIQLIVDNKHRVPPAIPDPELVKLYEDIRRLGNESTYTNIDDTKIYVIIGKLVDTTINKLLEYTIRQSISSWVLSLATQNSTYRNLTDIIKKTVDIIQQKDYIKISLGDIDTDAINELLRLNQRYTDFKLTQIEPNPNTIRHTTKPNEFIHYLYNINYFSTGNINANVTCYQINPVIASKLITSSTINSKNSDGNTPLHMAINMTHPKLVELLISKGANPKGFTNLHGQTAYDLGLSTIEKHIKFTDGIKLIDTINNFVIPFNDLLMSRLKDEKYGNNIVKNISMGIPIQLIMYNHMFHLYLENYRYGFTIELKQSIRNLFKKYFNHNDNIYPIDLFQITDQNQLTKIISSEIPENRIKAVVDEGNKRKINKYTREIKQIDIQLQGLIQEQTINTDPSLTDLIQQLTNRKNSLSMKIASLEIVAPDDPNILSVYMTVYESSVKSLPDKINRILDLVEFYNFAFGRIGHTKQLYLGIWENYMNKKLVETPSMIFSLLNNVILFLVNDSRGNRIDAELKTELTTIVNFYSLVRNYIELKNPNGNLEDDLLLAEEFKQITYLINLVLTPAVRNILLNQIYLGFREMDGANTIVQDQTVILDEIVNVEFNGQTLDSYLKNILPTLAIKYYTNIYTNAEDSDRKITTATDLFFPIIQIVKSNKVILVTDESILVKNLREYLVPFLANTYQYFIHHLRMAIYGYERYLLNTYQLLKIAQSLI
jgi:hypothetical protein